MAGFLTENTRDWLTIAGFALAVVQTVLAVATIGRPAPKATSSSPKRPLTLSVCVRGLAQELETPPRTIWMWTIAMFPGATLLILILLSIAPIPATGGGITLGRDDGGLLLNFAMTLGVLQGIGGLVLGAMLVTAGLKEGYGKEEIPRWLWVVAGAVAIPMFFGAVRLQDWSDTQPVSWGPRVLYYIGVVSLTVLPLLTLGSIIAVVEPVIDRWMERIQ